jgi:hypothetical protein
MKKLTVAFLVAAAPTPFGAGVSFAGQPNVSCEDGGTLTHGFTTSGFANAGDRYAGSPGAPSANNSQSGNAVSQYDIACFGGPK